MPVRIIGMIGVTPPASDATLHVIEGGLSPRYLVEFARAHDEAGFDLALVGYSSSFAEGFLIGFGGPLSDVEKSTVAGALTRRTTIGHGGSWPLISRSPIRRMRGYGTGRVSSPGSRC